MQSTTHESHPGRAAEQVTPRTAERRAGAQTGYSDNGAGQHRLPEIQRGRPKWFACLSCGEFFELYPFRIADSLDDTDEYPSVCVECGGAAVPSEDYEFERAQVEQNRFEDQ